jgi:hypothetical protein
VLVMFFSTTTQILTGKVSPGLSVPLILTYFRSLVILALGLNRTVPSPASFSCLFGSCSCFAYLLRTNEPKGTGEQTLAAYYHDTKERARSLSCRLPSDGKIVAHLDDIVVMMNNTALLHVPNVAYYPPPTNTTYYLVICTRYVC